MFIATLTTLPKRIQNLEKVIMSIIDQVDEVHLNLPHKCLRTGEVYTLPSFKHSKLKIFRTEDYGSMTKLIPTLKRTNNNDILLVIDDDQIYHQSFRDLKEKLKDDFSLISRRVFWFEQLLVHEAWAGYFLKRKSICSVMLHQLEFIAKNIKYGNLTDDLNISFLLQKHGKKTFSKHAVYETILENNEIEEINTENDFALKEYDIMNINRYRLVLPQLIKTFGRL